MHDLDDIAKTVQLSWFIPLRFRIKVKFYKCIIAIQNAMGAFWMWPSDEHSIYARIHTFTQRKKRDSMLVHFMCSCAYTDTLVPFCAVYVSCNSWKVNVINCLLAMWLTCYVHNVWMFLNEIKHNGRKIIGKFKSVGSK